MMNQSSTKEKIPNPNQPLEENPFNQEMLSSFCQEDTEEEELSFLNPLHQEAS
jgi:hypothetical protein